MWCAIFRPNWSVSNIFKIFFFFCLTHDSYTCRCSWRDAMHLYVRFCRIILQNRDCFWRQTTFCRYTLYPDDSSSLLLCVRYFYHHPYLLLPTIILFLYFFILCDNYLSTNVDPASQRFRQVHTSNSIII